MTCQTPIPEIYSENYRFLQEHVYLQSGIVLEGISTTCSRAAWRRS